MAALAATCGVLLVVAGFLFTGRTSGAQLAIEITAIVGCLILCFQAVILTRLKHLERRLDGLPARLGVEEDDTRR